MPFARRSMPFGIAIALAATFTAPAAQAQKLTLADLLSGIVHIKTTINPDGRTVKNLGHEREGTGIVIDNNGLVLTIGYLMLEADSAEFTTNDGHTLPAAVVGYDNETGFGLLRALTPLTARPVAFGKSSEVQVDDRELVVGSGGEDAISPVKVVSRRVFAGSWEYLLDDAIFTAPPHPEWSGAALVDREGKLVGIGSLILRNADGKDDGVAGNMFVPIDRLPPILDTLVANGRVPGPGHPWLGINTEEVEGHLVVASVTPDGPAQQAGVHRGDIILGVDGKVPATLAEFYRDVWAQGGAGVSVPLDVLQGGDKRRIDVKSINRLDNLKLKSTY